MSPTVSSERRRGRHYRSLAGGGFSLVALVIMLIVLNIAVAAAAQLWSKVAQRDKEEELIFRGFQYAEAIRVFQGRFNRHPTSLKELVEVRPRCLRQLWKDPLSESGTWDLILAGEGTDVTKQAAGREGEESTAEALSRAFDEVGSNSRRRRSPGLSSEEEAEEIGPIEGVRPTARGESTKVFLGSSDYESWEFRAQMLAEPRVSPEGVPLTPRIDPSGLGRAFPEHLSLAPGRSPHAQPGAADPFASSSSRRDDG